MSLPHRQRPSASASLLTALALLTLSACPPVSSGGDGASLPSHWTLSLSAADGQQELAPLSFSHAHGLRLRMDPSDYPKGLVGFSPLTLWGGGDCGEACEFLSTWATQVEAAGEACHADVDPAACAAEWEASGLSRSAVLQWRDGNDTVLAEWSLQRVFPTRLLEDGEGRRVLSLSLAGEVTAFAYADSADVHERLGGAPVAAIPPAAPADPANELEVNAFARGLLDFERRFRAPEDVTGDLDARTLRLHAESSERSADTEGSVGDATSADGPLLYGTHLAHPFTIEIDGAPVAVAGVAQGVGKEIEIIEYQNGDSPSARVRPGKVKVGRVTLRRVRSESDGALWNWYREGLMDAGTPRTVTLHFQGVNGGSWRLTEAVPTRWQHGPADPSSQMRGGLETIEIAVEKLERVTR